MSTAFLVAALAGTLVTGILATAACRDAKCFYTNLLVAAAGAFALTFAAAKIGIGYSEFSVDLGTGMVFSVVGGLVAMLFATMVRDLNRAEPSPHSPRLVARSTVRAVPASRPIPTKKRLPSDQELACADFQDFLQGDRIGRS